MREGARAEHLLALNIGNTFVKAGLFRGETLLARCRFDTLPHASASDYEDALNAGLGDWLGPGTHPRRAAFVSVVPSVDAALHEALARIAGGSAIQIRGDTPCGLEVTYRPSQALGADRLANMVAGYARSGGHTIVVDCGTATTFNCVDRRARFVGGAIAPGLKTAAASLGLHAAQLFDPQALVLPERYLALDTLHSLQTGIVWGHACLIEGLLAGFEKELTQLEPEVAKAGVKVIATGGWATLMASACPRIDEVALDLTLEGVAKIAFFSEEDSYS